MSSARRPHVLGIDDGPFEKRVQDDAPIVGVVMEGADLVEGVAMTRFPVDGDEVTAFLTRWVTGLRFHESLHGIVLGGITIAGLAVVDVSALAEATGVPVLVVNRRDPRETRLLAALEAAGLAQRGELLRRCPETFQVRSGIYVACAGSTRAQATQLVRASTGKAGLPEPLRIAHMIARAAVTGESRGRV